MENTEIFKLIEKEILNQDTRWGIRDQHPSIWLTILTEEVGEVANEICEGNFNVKEMNLDDYESELIQIAAVACQMVKNIKKYKNV